MASRKPSARAKRIERLRSELDGGDDLFAREERRLDKIAAHREEARYEKGCASKKRYPTKGEAQLAIAACAEHGRRGLSCYKCSYCGGWHLTSHPWTS